MAENSEISLDTEPIASFATVKSAILSQCLPATWLISSSRRHHDNLPQQTQDNLQNRSELVIPKAFLHLNKIKVQVLCCGDFHWIAFSDSNRMMSCGCNSYGQLGTGNTEHHSIPIDITDRIVSILLRRGISNWSIKEIATGTTYSHILVTYDEHSVALGWGCNEYGQVGSGSDAKAILVPEFIPLFDGSESDMEDYYISIVSGKNHTAAISQSGRLLTWGLNGNGQLGVGTTMFRCQPQAVEFFDRQDLSIKSVSCGQWHTLVLCNNNDVYQMGTITLPSCEHQYVNPFKNNLIEAKEAPDVFSWHIFSPYESSRESDNDSFDCCSQDESNDPFSHSHLPNRLFRMIPSDDNDWSIISISAGVEFNTAATWNRSTGEAEVFLWSHECLFRLLPFSKVCKSTKINMVEELSVKERPLLLRSTCFWKQTADHVLVPLPNHSVINNKQSKISSIIGKNAIHILFD